MQRQASIRAMVLMLSGMLFITPPLLLAVGQIIVA